MLALESIATRTVALPITSEGPSWWQGHPEAPTTRQEDGVSNRQVLIIPAQASAPAALRDGTYQRHNAQEEPSNITFSNEHGYLRSIYAEMRNPEAERILGTNTGRTSAEAKARINNENIPPKLEDLRSGGNYYDQPLAEKHATQKLGNIGYDAPCRHIYRKARATDDSLQHAGDTAKVSRTIYLGVVSRIFGFLLGQGQRRSAKADVS